jgi:hypothetical protein
LDLFLPKFNGLSLVKPTSDHLPCVIAIDTKIPRANIFRFENHWIQPSEFLQVVKNAWNILVGYSDSSCKEVMKHDRYFEQQRNVAGELGHSTYQKVTIALRMLAYGIPTDLVDDHLSMGESTDIMCVNRFVVAIV